MKAQWIEVEALVLQAQKGDREAFGELFERFQASVHAVALGRMRDVHEAAELVQEVFLHALRKIGQLREPTCFGAWLRRITVRVAINRAVRRPPLPTVSCEVLEAGEKDALSPVDELVRREARAKVRLAVASLRPIDRDALVAFYMQGKSVAQIADEFAVPLGTVKRRLHVARNRLQEALEGDEAYVTAEPQYEQPEVAQAVQPRAAICHDSVDEPEPVGGYVVSARKPRQPGKPALAPDRRAPKKALVVA